MIRALALGIALAATPVLAHAEERHAAPAGEHAAPEAEHPAPAEGAAEVPAAAAAAPILPSNEGPQLFKSVRALQTLQDAMVGGDANAQKVRVKLLASIAAQVAAGELGGGADRRNTRAAIVYILSGGLPELAKPYLDAADIDPALKPLLEGAAAYARGGKAEAAEKLLGAGLEGLPPGLAGQISLIRASLRKDGEHDLMRRDLALARSLMPGTLVEESALRRGAAVEAEARDRGRFEAIASRYFRRFPRSIYAGQFAGAFVRSVTELGYAGMPERFATLDALISELPAERAAFVFLELSRDAVLYGHRALAGFTARRALALAKPGTAALARAELYLGAVLAAGTPEEHGDAVRLLTEADRGELISEDGELLDQAMAVARNIRRETAGAAGPLKPNSTTLAAAERALKSLAETEAALAAGDGS